MTDPEFMNHAEALLRAVEQQCDQFNDETEADIDNQRVGGMITLTFPNRTQIVINLQKPLHEVWLASRTASTSNPLSVSSRMAKLGRSMAICRISARFISPPEKPSFT